MAYDPTPRLSPTTSLESTDSLVTPNHSDTFTFVDDCAVGEGVPDGHFLFKNSSEVWEEFKDAGCDPLGIPRDVADAGIPMSSSSSLLSGVDLLGDTPLPVLLEVPIPLGPDPHQVAVPRCASLFDFPSPPVLVPDRRMTMRESRPISGSPMMVNLASHPASGQGKSHESLPQQIRHSQSALQHWSTLPSPAVHPDKRRGPNELVTSDATYTRTFRTWAARDTVTRGDPPVVPRVPSFSTLPLGPGHTHDVSLPFRRSKKQEASDRFTSFIDMSPHESAPFESRIHRLFSKISGSFKSRKLH